MIIIILIIIIIIMIDTFVKLSKTAVAEYHSIKQNSYFFGDSRI